MQNSGQEENIDATLQYYDPFIKQLIRQKMPRDIVPSEVLDLEIDELAQITRYKLWIALGREHIININAYIRCIVNHEVINLIRHQKTHPTQSLPIDEQGELRQGRVLVTPSKGMKDPSYEIEQEEIAQDCMLRITEMVETLPPRQQYAIICSLKDRVDDLLPLIDTFAHHNIDIETVNWPTNEHDIQNLRVSLSIARKKIELLTRTRATAETSDPSTDESCPLAQKNVSK